jgi:hypothetical protein
VEGEGDWSRVEVIQSAKKKVAMRNYSVHPVDCRSPAPDSGFRRNDVSFCVVSNPVMPAKAGTFRYSVCFSSDELSSYGEAKKR